MEGRYKFSPYLEMLVLKGRGKSPRIIAKPTIRDRLALAALKEVLHKILPEDVPRALPNQVIRELLIALQASSDIEIVRTDISSFYDSISHKKLRVVLKGRVGANRVLSMIDQCLSTSIVPPNYHRHERQNYKINKGVPQGLPVSNFLAHLILIKFDSRAKKDFISYHRYVDDVVILVTKGTAKDVLTLNKKRLAGIGLRLNVDKSKTYAFGHRFEFLGYEITGKEAAPRLGSVERFIRSIAGMFAALKRRRLVGRPALQSWSAEQLANVFVEDLNEKITGAVSEHKQYGWVFYFNEATDLRAFHTIDRMVKKFSESSEHLSDTQRQRIKKAARAYFESKYSKTEGFIRNYDLISTHLQKLDFLLRLGYISDEQYENMPESESDRRYAEAVLQRLSKLEGDVGLIS